MPICHRDTDQRVCGATTQVVGQDFVKVDGLLWSVEGDPDTHGSGGVIHTQDFVFISGILVILLGDQANPDSLCLPDGPPHCDPFTTSGDSLITVTG